MIAEWKAYVRGKVPGRPPLPDDVPSSPHRSYESEWQGWRDWLRVNYRPFEEARAFARTLGLRTTREWAAFRASGRLPHDVPGKPERVYAGKGWSGMEDWLGKTMAGGQ